MNQLQIKQEHLPIRCEICHQNDLFNPETGYCLRCKDSSSLAKSNSNSINKKVRSQFVPCPKCISTEISEVTFTWWGGLIGPKLFNHVKCNRCNYTFNGLTGQSNKNKIVIYNSVVIFIIIILMVVLQIIRHN